MAQSLWKIVFSYLRPSAVMRVATKVTNAVSVENLIVFDPSEYCLSLSLCSAMIRLPPTLISISQLSMNDGRMLGV